MIIAQRERLTRKPADNKEIAAREFSVKSRRAFDSREGGRKEGNVSNTYLAILIAQSCPTLYLHRPRINRIPL